MAYRHRSVYSHSVRNSRVSRYYNSSDRNKILEERKKSKDTDKTKNSYDKKLASANIINNNALYGNRKTNLQSVINNINSVNINNALGKNENNALSNLLDDIDELNKYFK